MRPPDLRPNRELGGSRPHGHRMRYLSGCKCLKCRMANSNYETSRARERRAGRPNDIVDAAPVVAHLRTLSRAGVGYKTVADAADVGHTCLHLIMSGRRKRMRRQALERVLRVTKSARSDGARIGAAGTWLKIEQLIEEGFTRSRIAREIGNKGKRPSLQIRHGYVLARTALAVEKLWRRYMLIEPVARRLGRPCRQEMRR